MSKLSLWCKHSWSSYIHITRLLLSIRLVPPRTVTSLGYLLVMDTPEEGVPVGDVGANADGVWRPPVPSAQST